MTLDREGNVYLTGGRGVSIFDPSGKLLQRIAVPQRWTANVCFGGADRRSLYITAGDSLYRLPMKVAGW
jgi:gluconolactonase